MVLVVLIVLMVCGRIGRDDRTELIVFFRIVRF